MIIFMIVMLISSIVMSTQLKKMGNILKDYKDQTAKSGVAEDVLMNEDTELIIGTLQDFSSAYNKGDLSGVLDCIDDSLSGELTGGIELVGTVGEVFDVFIPNFFNLFGLSMELLSDKDVVSFYIWDIEVRQDRAISDLTMTYSCYNGLIEQGQELSFLFTKENDNWIISGMLETSDKEMYREEIERFLDGSNLWIGI